MSELLILWLVINLAGIGLIVKFFHPLFRQAGWDNFAIWSATIASPFVVLVFVYVLNVFPQVNGVYNVVLLLAITLSLTAILAYLEPTIVANLRTLVMKPALPVTDLEPVNKKQESPETHGQEGAVTTSPEDSSDTARSQEQQNEASVIGHVLTPSNPTSQVGVEAKTEPRTAGETQGQGLSEELPSASGKIVASNEDACFADCLEKGFLCKEKGDWEGALVNFTRGIQQALDEETHVRLAMEIALIKNTLGKGEEAIQDLSRELLLLGPEAITWRQEIITLIRFIQSTKDAITAKESTA